ncbi:hypothetical protein FQZ97_772830 [compost metagenome]
MSKVTEMAFHGQWDALLDVLRNRPELVNEVSEGKGYAPLHQAAWHGASLPVIGELLALGADPHLRTLKQQTAQDIAIDKHPDHEALAFILTPGYRSLSQLMRMVVAEQPSLFTSYDGNQIVCDRLIELFSLEITPPDAETLPERIGNAIRALTGLPLSSRQELRFDVASFQFTTDACFWKERFIPALQIAQQRFGSAPFGKSWAVVADLFDPAPSQWGLRGDLFLWLEMRRSLCHVGLPETPEALSDIVHAAHETLAGARLSPEAETWVPHLARGGMSSGMVSGDFWCRQWIPVLRKRLQWLHESWRFPARS